MTDARLRAFASYVALGDSISIDKYPGLGLGAASLLCRNHDERFPEFAGRDLTTLNPGIVLTNLARDGATTHDVLRILDTELQGETPGPVLVTLTVGGNDFLGSLFRMGEDPASAIVERIDGLIPEIRSRLAPALILLATVYDPTDGVGDLWAEHQSHPMAETAFRSLNDGIRAIADRHSEVSVADVHAHFLGHGKHHEDPRNPHYRADDPSCWVKLRIEPNTRGGSEVRRVFWTSLSEWRPAR